ncbi:MAG: rod shape-determining protein MreC [Bacteroidales bacterium]|nr:rod shape-determining protein MreC [Candidatus Liminaster caballi]
MLNLLRFFAKNLPFFTWLLLALVSSVLLFQRNPYQRSVWFGSANAVCGSLYEMSSNVTGYFGLRQINEDLLVRIGNIEEENLMLRQQLQRYADADSVLLVPRQYNYQIAHVINNSITSAENYLTLDKGENDGVRVGMSVADQNGAIGIVSKVSSRFSQVISVLNPKLRLSVCLKETDTFGSLVWDGKDPAYAWLEDLPRNVRFQEGDTVITTGYGSSFPRGINVGRVVSAKDASDNNFLSFRIELFTHFDCIHDVLVIDNRLRDEELQINQ